jgi:hypothetical protein
MHDKDGDALLLVLPDLPSELREPLVRQLQLTFGQRLAVTDSQKAGEELRFETFHFTHYNRYSAQVPSSPSFYVNFLMFYPGRQMSFNSGSCYLS